MKGKVYIRAHRYISGIYGIEFKVKGGSKNAFTRYWDEMTSDGEDDEGNKKYRWKSMSERLRGEDKFLSSSHTASESF